MPIKFNSNEIPEIVGGRVPIEEIQLWKPHLNPARHNNDEESEDSDEAIQFEIAQYKANVKNAISEGVSFEQFWQKTASAINSSYETVDQDSLNDLKEILLTIWNQESSAK